MLQGVNCLDNKRSQGEVCLSRDLGNLVLLPNKNSCWRIPPESPRITFVPPPSAAGDFAKAVLAGSDRSYFGRSNGVETPAVVCGDPRGGVPLVQFSSVCFPEALPLVYFLDSGKPSWRRLSVEELDKHSPTGPRREYRHV